MRASTRIRTLLRENDTGLPIADICEALDMRDENVRAALSTMPDVYIDRWEKVSSHGPLSAIWRAVFVPANAPRPRAQTNEFRAAKQREYTNDWRKRKREAERTGEPIVLKVVQKRPPTKVKPEPEPKYQPQGLTQIRGPWPTHH